MKKSRLKKKTDRARAGMVWKQDLIQKINILKFGASGSAAISASSGWPREKKTYTETEDLMDLVDIEGGHNIAQALSIPGFHDRYEAYSQAVEAQIEVSVRYGQPPICASVIGAAVDNVVPLAAAAVTYDVDWPGVTAGTAGRGTAVIAGPDGTDKPEGSLQSLISIMDSIDRHAMGSISPTPSVFNSCKGPPSEREDHNPMIFILNDPLALRVQHLAWSPSIAAEPTHAAYINFGGTMRHQVSEVPQIGKTRFGALQISSVKRPSNDPSVRDVSPSTDGGKRLGQLNVRNIGMLYTNKATAPASIAHGCHLRREFHSFFKAGATTTIWGTAQRHAVSAAETALPFNEKHATRRHKQATVFGQREQPTGNEKATNQRVPAGKTTKGTATTNAV
ncbi:hypothetical protein B0H13DRAFT_1899990 [Mycena leptocephala]|nr:hypothetical protein B0H13DRAFT_1899990 [Mycena leptocephala]